MTNSDPAGAGTDPLSSRTRARRPLKTVAAWLALMLGAFGAHRFYLYGWRDTRAWLYLPPTLIGGFGVLRMRALGQDDGLAAVLIPLLGLSVSAAMLAAIVLALTSDESWQQRHHPQQPPRATGWGAVLAAMAGLFIGAAVLMSTIAFGGQRFFEWQLENTPSQIR